MRRNNGRDAIGSMLESLPLHVEDVDENVLRYREE